MSDICLPIDAVSGAPVFPAASHRVAQAALTLGRTDRPLGAVSGISPGSEPTLSISGSTWTVTPFAAVVDPGTSLSVGAFLVAFTSNKTGNVNAADGSNDRIDRLDVQVPDDPSGAFGTAPVIQYTAGTPGSGVAPAAPARSIPLATITVPKAGTGSPSIAAAYGYTAAAGGILVCANSGAYPASPYVGQIVYDKSIGDIKRWTGIDWRRPKGTGYGGSASGTTNSSGYATITHGLPFTPARINVMSTQGGVALASGVAIPFAVDSITATNFRVRFFTFSTTSGSDWLMNLADAVAYAITWTAFE